MSKAYIPRMMEEAARSFAHHHMTLSVLCVTKDTALGLGELDQGKGVKIRLSVGLDAVDKNQINVGYSLGITFEPISEIWETCRHEDTRVPEHFSRSPLRTMPPHVTVADVERQSPPGLERNALFQASEDLTPYFRKLARYLVELGVPLAEKFCNPDVLVNAIISQPDKVWAPPAIVGAALAYSRKSKMFEVWVQKFLNTSGAAPHYTDAHYVHCLRNQFAKSTNIAQ